MSRDVQFGRLFIRAFKTRGSGFCLRAHQRTVVLWMHRLMVEVSWLHREQCECDTCDYERAWGDQFYV